MSPAADHTGVHSPTPIITPGRPVPPSPAVRRAAVVAARSATQGNSGHPAVYQPWTTLEKQADARFRAEINDALQGLEQALSQAGTILDTSSASAAEAAARLESAAWARWHKDMTAAEETRSAIMGPAVTAYEQAIGYAHAAYQRALQAAETAYKSVLADARRAQNDGKSIVA